MPRSESRYCIVGIHYADAPDKPEILAINGQVVVFDTLNMAREVLPRLSAGRPEFWDKTREVVCFSPLLRAPDSFNRLSIYTGYDPYNCPNGFLSKGIRSEAVGLDWKNHVYWRHVLPQMLLWADNLAAKHDPALQMAA